MTERPTASSITDAQLDALHATLADADEMYHALRRYRARLITLADTTVRTADRPLYEGIAADLLHILRSQQPTEMPTPGTDAYHIRKLEQQLADLTRRNAEYAARAIANGERADDTEQRAERYRLAWQSAWRRARDRRLFRAELDQVREQCAVQPTAGTREFAEQERARMEKLYTREYTRADKAERRGDIWKAKAQEIEADRDAETQRADKAEQLAAELRTHAEQAETEHRAAVEAALDRVRQLAASLQTIGRPAIPEPIAAEMIRDALDGTAPAPAATRAEQHEQAEQQIRAAAPAATEATDADDTVHTCPGRWAGPDCRCFDTDPPAPVVVTDREAIRTTLDEPDPRADAEPLPGFIKIRQCHTYPSGTAWTWRCNAGTDACPGWVGLDLGSKDAAEREARRHLAEQHAEDRP